MRLDEFTKGYVECTLWLLTDEEGNDVQASVADLAPDTLAEMVRECDDFQRGAAHLMERARKEYGASDEYMGHDFYLTRNGHGAGFWDRGWGDLGDRLSDACKPHGSSSLYIGDNGLLYLCG